MMPCNLSSRIPPLLASLLLPNAATELPSRSGPANTGTVARPSGVASSFDFSSLCPPASFPGSSWAFGAIGAVEGAIKVASGTLVSLSEQQLVDCDRNSMGCGGGSAASAIDYTTRNGLATTSSYPYISGTTRASGRCQNVRSWADIQPAGVDVGWCCR